MSFFGQVMDEWICPKETILISIKVLYEQMFITALFISNRKIRNCFKYTLEQLIKVNYGSV